MLTDAKYIFKLCWGWKSTFCGGVVWCFEYIFDFNTELFLKKGSGDLPCSRKWKRRQGGRKLLVEPLLAVPLESPTFPSWGFWRSRFSILPVLRNMDDVDFLYRTSLQSALADPSSRRDCVCSYTGFLAGKEELWAPPGIPIRSRCRCRTVPCRTLASGSGLVTSVPSDVSTALP